MKGFLFCVYDKASRQFMPPFFSPTKAVAKRDFVLGAYQSMTPIQDLELHCIGSVSYQPPLDDDFSGQVIVNGLKNSIVDITLSDIESYTKVFTEMTNTIQGEN